MWYPAFGFRAMCILARKVLPLSYKPRKSRSSSLNCFVLFHMSRLMPLLMVTKIISREIVYICPKTYFDPQL